MLTLAVVTNILDKYYSIPENNGIFVFTPPIIKAIERIPKERRTELGKGSERLTEDELWSIAQVHAADPSALTAYATQLHYTNNQILNKTIKIFNFLFDKKILTKENMRLLTDPALCESLISLADSKLPDDVGAFLLRHLKEYSTWSRIITWLKKFQLDSLDNLKKISDYMIAFDDLFTRHASELSASHAANKKLLQILIQQPQNIKVISEIFFGFVATHPDNPRGKFVTFIEEQKIEDAQIISYAKNIANHKKLTKPVMAYIRDHPDRTSILLSNLDHADAMIYLLKLRPGLHENICKHYSSCQDARDSIVLLKNGEQLCDEYIDYIIGHLSIAADIYNCLHVLSINKLNCYFHLVLELKDDFDKIAELSWALGLFQDNVMTPESFESVYSYSSAFSKAAKVLSPNNVTHEHCEYMLSSPENAEFIARALVFLRNYRGIEPYKPLIIQHPKHAYKLMSGLLSVITNIQGDVSEIIAIVQSNPAYADTLAESYPKFRRSMTHEQACQQMKESPEYALAIADAICELDSMNLDEPTKNFLRENIPFEIQGITPVIPVSQLDKPRQINFSDMLVKFVPINSDYANFILAEKHKSNKFNSEEYVSNARRYYRKIEKNSPWYLSAQQGLCELLYMYAKDLQDSGVEPPSDVIEELNETVKIVENNHRHCDFFSFEKPGEIISRISDPECSEDQKHHGIATQTEPVKILSCAAWRIKVPTITQGNSSSAARAPAIKLG